MRERDREREREREKEREKRRERERERERKREKESCTPHSWDVPVLRPLLARRFAHWSLTHTHALTHTKRHTHTHTHIHIYTRTHTQTWPWCGGQCKPGNKPVQACAACARLCRPVEILCCRTAATARQSTYSALRLDRYSGWHWTSKKHLRVSY